MSELYNQFLNPQNIGDTDEPGFTGQVGSFICGSTTRFSIQIDESQIISQAKFRAAGCESLIAAASILTNRVIGISTAEAAATGNHPTALMTELEIDSCNRHCVQLACDALVAAIREYSDAARSEWNGDEALICSCFFVSEKTIEREIKLRGLTTVREVTQACNAGGGCGSCQPLIVEILEGRGIGS